ncbi:peptidase S1 [soil metagenome]
MRLTLFFGAAFIAACMFSAVPADAQNLSLSPTYGDIRLSAGFTPDPRSYSLTAGGSRAVNMGACDYGFVANAPDFNFYYTAGSTFPLYIWASANRDLTLLINTPDGRWYCDDDSGNGLDPMMYFANPQSGLYNIWVGTYTSDMSPATLYVSELNPNR